MMENHFKYFNRSSLNCIINLFNRTLYLLGIIHFLNFIIRYYFLNLTRKMKY